MYIFYFNCLENIEEFYQKIKYYIELKEKGKALITVKSGNDENLEKDIADLLYNLCNDDSIEWKGEAPLVPPRRPKTEHEHEYEVPVTSNEGFGNEINV